MTHGEKVTFMIADLQERGVGKRTSAPPVFRLLWKMGWQVTPPLFQPFGSLFVGFGSSFAIGWGTLMWFGLWRRQGIPVTVVAGGSLAAGILFGLAMAGFMRWKAKKLGLPSWTDYGKNR